MNLKFLLILVSFVLAFLLLETYGQKIKSADQQKFLSAEVNILSPQNFKDLAIESRAAISVLLDNDGKETILFEKNADQKLPIASLAKLMTADIVLENYDPDQTADMSGEKFLVKDLLASMLVESNNQAAAALAEIIGQEHFVELMNDKAEKLRLKNTHFFNPIGLDDQDLTNYSSARDLAKLAEYLADKKPVLWEISSIPEFDFYSSQGVFHHKATSTNELLGKISSLVGGKTGETPKSKGCLLFVLKAPQGDGYLINIILGSEDRFGEMQKLIQRAYDKNTVIFNNISDRLFGFIEYQGKTA